MPLTLDKPKANDLARLNLHLAAKDHVHHDGSMQHVALYVDWKNQATVLCVKPEGQPWSCELFVGSLVRDEPAEPVGRFQLDRLSKGEIHRMSRRAVKAWRARAERGQRRLVYDVS